VVKGSVCDSRTVAPKHDPRKEARRRARLFTRRQGGRIGETRADSRRTSPRPHAGDHESKPLRPRCRFRHKRHPQLVPVALGGDKPLEEPPPTAGLAKTYTARGTGSDPVLDGRRRSHGIAIPPSRPSCPARSFRAQRPSFVELARIDPTGLAQRSERRESTWTFELKRRRSLNRPIGVLRATWESVARRERTR
jgi:hypothetical protein